MGYIVNFKKPPILKLKKYFRVQKACKLRSYPKSLKFYAEIRFLKNSLKIFSVHTCAICIHPMPFLIDSKEQKILNRRIITLGKQDVNCYIAMHHSLSDLLTLHTTPWSRKPPASRTFLHKFKLTIDILFMNDKT